MKKFILLIALIIFINEFKEHPYLAPTVNKIKNIVLSNAKESLKIEGNDGALQKLNLLRSKLLPHEFNYVTEYIKDKESVETFWRANCGETPLAHPVLTSFAKKQTCLIIEPYI